MMIWKIALILWMAAMIIASFLFTHPAIGFPGETSRILFFHVPQAWMAALCFFMSMIGSCMYLKTRKKKSDDLALSTAELGFLFCVLAMVTGSIFAKATWGSYWNWDPRETSIVILLMIYGAYFGLRSAVADPEKKRVFAGVYSILAVTTVPFLVFIVPRITTSLHPEDTMNPSNPGMDPRTLIIFLGSLLAYTVLFIWMLGLRMRVLALNAREEISLLQKHNPNNDTDR